MFSVLTESSYIREDSKDILPEKNAPIAGNVVKGWTRRNSIDHAGMARKIGCPELKLRAFSALVNHTSLPEGVQLTFTMADCRGDKVRLLPDESHHHYIARAVSGGGMLGECHPVSLGRDAHVG